MRRSIVWVLAGLAVGVVAALSAYVAIPALARQAGQSELTTGNPAQPVVNGAEQHGAASEPTSAAVEEFGATDATSAAAVASGATLVTAPGAAAGVPVASPTPTAPPSAEDFRRAVSDYEKSYQEHKRKLQEFGPSEDKQLMQHHKALQQLLYAAAGQWGSFPRVRAELAPYITWCEAPKMPCDTASGTETRPLGYDTGGLPESATDTLPLVYYLDCDGRNARATAMMHVMVMKGTGEVLTYVQTSPFAIANVEGRLYFTPDIMHDDSLPIRAGRGRGTQLVGTVDIQQTLPAVVTMENVYTNAGIAELNVWGFNPADGKWCGIEGHEWASVRNWQYERQDHRLTVFIRDQNSSENVVSEVVNVGQLATKKAQERWK